MEEIYGKITDSNEYGIDTDVKSKIQEFYAGQTVFLTGCTGYVGKCVVEKILRGCPDIKKLYLMIRPKKISAKERVQEYFDDILFEKMREMFPDYQSKVEAIDGNLDKENLGLSEKDRSAIINEATIFFHNASNVKFEAKLSECFICNIFGTKYMLDLAKECKHLRVFVYVSTAYSHCYERRIYEKCYPTTTNLKMIQDCIDVDKETPGGMSNEAKKMIIAPWPNTYSFSKATAENLVEQYSKEVSFRCCIFRPSVVLSTYREPIIGWTGNVNGPVLVFLGSGLGICHTGYLLGHPIDFVPVDMCANGLLAITWDSVENRKETGNVLVYNYGTSVVNPIDLISFESWVVPRGRETPSKKMVGPHFTIPSNRLSLFIFFHIFLHCVPALLADIALLVSLQKPKATAVLFKVTKWLPAIFFFSNGNWRIHVSETQKCWDMMNKRDSDLFYNDLRTLKWDVFGFSYWPGLRVYVIKDPMTTLDQALRRYHFIQRSFHVFNCIMILAFVYYFSDYFLLLLVPFHNLIKLYFNYFNIG